MFRGVSLAALFLWLMSSLAVVAVQDSANDKDKNALKGEWEVVSYLVDGQEAKPTKAGYKWYFYFDGDKIRHEAESRSKDGTAIDSIYAGTFTLDAAKAPKWIDLPGRKSKGANIYPNRPGAPGIYELKGDELKICAGAKRPTEFSSTEKNGQMLIVAKRAKK
jgi:uncharacterized protein (TIGR03067 family)